ncbi:MAG: hypothetical protein PHQ41_02515 [Candidatus Cloacimonetes bacterium]|nr:hypothetical protein [Candidatus Cloacimonadota bacterium]
MVVIREAEIVINPVDNVTPALSRLANMISGRFSGVRMDIELADTIFSDLQRVTDLTAGLGEKVNIDVALNDNSANVARSISNNSQQAAHGVEKIADASSKVGRELNETERKSSRFFSNLEQSSRSVVASLDGVLTKFAAIAVTGSAGGVSWLGAKSSEKYKQEVIESIATRNGMPEAAIAKKFIGEAGEPGQEYTSGSQRADLMRYIELNTRARGENATSAVRGVEKLAFSSETAERLGYDAESLMRIATRKSLSGLRPDQKSDIESIFGKDFTKKGLTTRMRILAEFDKKIDINEAMEEDPEKVLQFKLDAMSKSVGKAMIGPMNSLLDVSLKVVDGLASIPGMPQIAGVGLMATTAGIGLKLMFDAAGMASDGMMGVARVLGLTKKAEGELLVVQKVRAVATAMSNAMTWASVTARSALTSANTAEAVSQAMATGAMEGDFVATELNTVAKNQGIVARARLTASTYASAVAERAHTAATMIGSAITWARVAAVGAITGATFANIGITSASSIAMGGLTAAEALATVGAYALASGVWAALSPLLPFVAAGAALAIVLGAVAAKAGLLEPLLKGLGKINVGQVWKDLMKGDLDKAWRDITKGFKFPSGREMWANLTEGLPDLGKIWDGLTNIKLPSLADVTKNLDMPKITFTAAVGPVGLILKPLLDMIRLLGGLVDGSSTIEDILAAATKNWATMVGILSGMWSSITGMISWLRDGLGITKADRKKELEQEAAKTGNQAEGGLWKGAKWVDDASNYAKHQWYKAPGWYESTSSAEAHLLPEAAQARLNARKVKYESTPGGFFEGIPGINELTSAIGALTAAIPNIPSAGEAWDKASGFVTEKAGEAWNTATEFAAEKASDVATTLTNLGIPTTATEPTSQVYWNKMGKGITTEEFSQLSPGERTSGEWSYDSSGSEPAAEPEASIPKSYTNGKETISPKAWGTLDSDQKEHWTPQYAIGATFNKGGLFTGQVHEKEEIIPQAIAQKGTGPLSKVLGALQESGQDVASPVLDRKGPDPLLKAMGDLQQGGQGPSGRSVNINIEEQLRVEVINPVVPDTGAAYQLTDIMKRQLDSHIEQTIMRKVAQYIT